MHCLAAVGARVSTVLLFMLVSAGAMAQATRTWVSGVGDDVNPCSRTAPCKTFAGAIAKTAAGGEISVLDPGGYGGVTITKAITINGRGTLAGVLVSGTNGIVVNAGVNDVVVLRSLDVNGIGTGTNGVHFVAGKALHVEDCDIYGFAGQGINFAPAGDSQLFVDRTRIRNNAGGAIHVHPGPAGFADAAIGHVEMHRNGRGIRAEDGSSVLVRNSLAAGNAMAGFNVVSAARVAKMTVEGSAATANMTGVRASGALASVLLNDSTIADNTDLGLSNAGGSIVSWGNNRVHGNAGGNGAPTTIQAGM
jgi:hypothetical protein